MTLTAAPAAPAVRVLPAPLRAWRPAPPPRLLTAASVLVLAVTATLMVLGAFRTGITTDEPIHVMRLRNYLDNGWYALDWDYRGDGPGSADTNTFVYAPVTMLLLHAWSVLWGVEGWGEVSTTPHAYDVRHLGDVLIALVGLAAVAAIGRVLLRQWRWGLVAAATLAAIPMWTGHAMVNVKDVPVATGHTLATLGLLLFVRDEPSRLVVRGGRIACLVGGLVLTLGTRPGMWSGLLAAGLVAVAGIALSMNARRALVALGELAASAAVAAGVLVATYPNLFGHPLRALPRTTESSSSFLDGERTDRLYVPRHLAEEMPTLLLLFLLAGTTVALLVVWRHWRSDPVPAARVAMVGVQAFALPVAAILLGSDLYHGLRQLLFAVPAMAVLATYGMAHLRGRLAGVLAVLALLLPLADEVTLQPYQTTYVNLVTDLLTGPFAGPDARPGGDFWRVSLPELVAHAPLDRQLLCKAKVDQETDRAYRFTDGAAAYSTNRSLDCREEPTGPLWPSHLPARRDPGSGEFDAVFLKTLPENCTPLDEVSRWRHGFDVTLTLLGRCTVEVPTLPATRVSVTDAALGTGTGTDLWRYAVDGWVQWPSEPVLVAPVPVAEIALRAPSAGTLVLGGSAPADLVVRVGGTEAPVVRAEGSLRIAVGAAQAAAPDGLWVTFSRRSGKTLDMRLTDVGWERLKGQG
ncbi:MAG: hypothetical protein J7518_20325 [Nocardioidaceae bacterium]|nr:hypothetical protein [Nocardioidaceae bacterium]